MKISWHANGVEYLRQASLSFQKVRELDRDSSNREEKENSRERSFVQYLQEENEEEAKFMKQVETMREMSRQSLSTAEKAVKMTYRINELFGYHQSFISGNGYLNKMNEVVDAMGNDHLFSEMDKARLLQRDSIAAIRDKIKMYAEQESAVLYAR